MRIAGIILFKPELERLKENINSIIPQVDKLILYRNSEFECVGKWDDEKIIMLNDGQINHGMAKAANQIMKQAEELGAEWCLFYY